MKKILLINPPLDPCNKTPLYGEFRPYPPLALLALATFLKNKMVDADIKVLDGQICSLEKIIKTISEISPSIVGISPFLVSYNNTLKLRGFQKKWVLK